ncbi:MAG: PilZ domain-containing protein [Treponema sp.]|nr:PilZ domain-containing protein [Treponema sp.]
MNRENRQETRYQEIGRVDAPEICALNGILDDISDTGCKVHFSCPVKVSLENEYNLKFTLSSYSEEPPLQLVCKPMWVKKENTETQIGFKYLFSPDDSRLHEIINHLEEMEDDSPEII